MCRIEAGMHTVTTLIAIFVIVTAIALVTSGSFTTSTLAVKKKSTVTTKKSTGSKKIKTHRHAGTGSSGTTGGTSSGSTLGGGTGTSTLGGSSSGGSGTTGGTDPFSKFISCMGLSAGPLTRAGVDQCYNIVYGTSSTSSSVGSPPHMGPSGNVAPTLGTP
jgi:hypothetical protein